MMETKLPSGLDTLKRCYRILQLGVDASPAAIKRQYRHLAKQWHPDKFPSGSAEQTQALSRMQQINDAYRLIRYAPLRYYAPARTRPVTTRVTRRPRPAKPIYTEEELREHAASSSRSETLLRFAAGSVFGLIVFFLFLLFRPALPAFAVLFSGIAIPAALGFCSVRYGDDFWKNAVRLLFPNSVPVEDFV